MVRGTPPQELMIGMVPPKLVSVKPFRSMSTGDACTSITGAGPPMPSMLRVTMYLPGALITVGYW